MAKIIVVGCGFIGSHVAEELPKMAFSQDLFNTKFRFIDFDTWEERNAANQNVTLKEAKDETKKAETCASYARQYGFESEAVDARLEGKNAKDLLEGGDLVIDCLDNIPTRQLLWGFGISDSPCPVLHSGISRKGNGIINWSSKVFDSFPFKPQTIAGRDLNEQDFKEPPCEMYKYRASGLVLVQAIAKATAFFLGKDPWEILQGTEQEGVLTCWNTSLAGANLLSDAEYLIDDFFPIYNRGE